MLLCVFILSACSIKANKSHDYLSVIIENRTKKEIVANLETIVSNYGYSKFSETENGAVFETQPELDTRVAYLQYDMDYRYNAYSGYRNRRVKPPHYQLLFDFTQIKNGILVESTLEFLSWEHIHDENRNTVQGVEVQKILNELKFNSDVDSNNTRYGKYQTIEQLLKDKLSTQKTTNPRENNYIRKVVLSTADYNRQVRAFLFVREQIKNYCDFHGGIFKDDNDREFYSSNGLKIPNIFYDSFNEANNLQAFGKKRCLNEDGVKWRLVIKPKVIKAVKLSGDDAKNAELTKFKNPEMYLYIFMLENNLPSFMRPEG